MQIPSTVLARLQRILGKGQVRTEKLSLMLNGYDCSASSHRPDAVLHITDASQLPSVVCLLAREKIPFVVRAAATNHAGSCAAVKGGVVLNLNALNRLHQIDTQHNFAEVDPCVVTGQLQEALKPLHYFYAPDPASEQVSTLGGNLAQNASGARCLKYGNTADNTLEIEFITPDGQTHVLRHDHAGPDWVGLVAGSEGTLGIIKRLRVQILPAPKYIRTFLITFHSLADSVQTVTDLVAQGLIPRCVEAMDRLTIQTIENFTHAGYPNAEALLIIELDGNSGQIEQDEHTLQTLCHKNHCLSFTAAHTEEQRQQLWQGRRAAYSAMAALAPNVAVGDGTVPRSQLPTALARVRQIIEQNGVQASLLFHAGDGNFHPQIVFDARQHEQTHRVQKTLKEILKTCVDAGGTLSGEHGIGVEKRALMAYQYSRETLRLFQQIKHAFDPNHLANPEKIIPIGFEENANPHIEKDAAVLALAQQIKQRFIHAQKSYITHHSGSYPSAWELSAQTLQKILEIDTSNYTATVQAGVSVAAVLSALQAQKAYARLPDNYDGTLGGLVACKAVPDFTNQIIGVQAILPNGDIVQYGGKVMKNAAGYNLCRLFSGSWGGLGLITQITFKIYATAQCACLQQERLQPQAADALFRAVKKEIDPQGLFLSPVFHKELL